MATSTSYATFVNLAITDLDLEERVEQVLANHPFDLQQPVCTVTDDPTFRGDIVIFIARSSDIDCQRAIEGVMKMNFHGLVTSATLERLPAVIVAVSFGLVAAPLMTIKSAYEAPRISERKRDVLELLIRGNRNNEIANKLHVSEATIKREVSDLLTIFNCRSRVELALRRSSSSSDDRY